MAHVSALRAFGDDLPVGVMVFVEGEEEFGSESLEELLLLYRADLSADVIVIADSGNWDIGQPALTTSLRGIVNCFVDVRTLDHAVHSGMFGGAVPDALMTLSRLLATLHDDAGDVTVEGLVRREAAPLEYPEHRLRVEGGVHEGVSLIGTGRLVDRMWTRPAISVLGIDAPATAEAPNALVPTARAKVSVRIAPGDDPKKAFLALQAHLERHAPWGCRLTVTLEHDGAPCVIDSTGPAYDAARAAFTAAWDGVGAGGHRGRRLNPVHRDVPGACSRRRRSWSPASRTPTRGPTARTRACTWASSPGSAWPRLCCSPRSPSRSPRARPNPPRALMPAQREGTGLGGAQSAVMSETSGASGRCASWERARTASMVSASAADLSSR